MDIRHFYVEKGQGEPLILLHGNGESSDYFKRQIDEFSRLYHVYAVDTSGNFGDRRNEGYGFFHVADPRCYSNNWLDTGRID